MDPSTVVAAGPSNIPPPIISRNSSGRQNETHKKRRPKRKRIASEASTSVAGEHAEAADGDGEAGSAEKEAWSAPWVDRLGTTSYDSKEQRLHDEIVAFFQYISPTADEAHARAMVIAQISDVVRRRFPEASVDTFGSVAQNLYLPDGDTDLVVNTPKLHNDDTKKRALFQMAALMRTTRVTPHVQVIHRARVPVISFQTMPELGSLKIDISLNATDGVKAVPILRDWFDRLPALRFLVLCIKSLLSRHGLNTASSSGLSSYGVICLAISFLQLNPMARPAAALERPMESESLGVLLMDFLDYYGNKFDYEGAVVSVNQGKLLSKEEKGWENPNTPASLCIECMLNPENDVGRPTSKIGKIRQVFKDAYKALESYAFSDSPAEHNILGTTLGISESTLAHRILLKDIVTSGRLTQALRDVEYASTSMQYAPGGAARRFQQQQSYPRPNSRPNGGGLPPKPAPPRQTATSQHTLPPRPNPPPQKTPYVAQGPSFAALRAAASVNGKSDANGNGNTSSNTNSTSGSPKSVRSPPRRRRKAA